MEDYLRLKEMKLNNLTIMNTWCDKKVNEARKLHITHPYTDIYPHEKWALFTTYPTLQKVTGQLDTAIIGQKHQDGLRLYLQKKHNIGPELLDHINLNSLQHIILSQNA
jgi:hypothetical protein